MIVDLDFGLNLDKCPAADDEEWFCFELQDLPKYRNHFDIGIPELIDEDYWKLIWATLSPYRYLQYIVD